MSTALHTLCQIWATADAIDSADEWLAASIRLQTLAGYQDDDIALDYYRAAVLAIARARIAQ